MDNKQLQHIVLQKLAEVYPDEGNLGAIFDEHAISITGAEYGSFTNKQLITPGYVEFGSSPFHFSLTADGKKAADKLGKAPLVKKAAQPKTAQAVEKEESLIMPNLKPANWEQAKAILCTPLLDRMGNLADIPLIAFGYDRPDHFEFIPAGKLPLPEDEIRTAAMDNICAEQATVDESDMGGFKMMVVTGSYFAAEKILDTNFMQQMQHRLDAPLLAVSIPRKGTMYIANGVMPTDQLNTVCRVTEMKYNENEREPALSKQVFTVQNGDVVGLLNMATSTKKGGFFSRLFGKK